MKKVFIVGVLSVILSSCGLQNIPGNIAEENVLAKVIKSKSLSDDEFVKTKIQVGNYLNLSEDVKSKLLKHFASEKEELNKVEEFQEQELARIIVKYETNFRKFLNEDQLEVYKKLRKRFDEIYFYSQYSMDVIKNRYFKLKQ
jgi:small-conductance mechanosensitive channel